MSGNHLFSELGAAGMEALLQQAHLQLQRHCGSFRGRATLLQPLHPGLQPITPRLQLFPLHLPLQPYRDQ